MAAVVGRQYVEHSNKPMQMEIDIYLPVFTILQFFFFMGLLKVHCIHEFLSNCYSIPGQHDFNSTVFH